MANVGTTKSLNKMRVLLRHERKISDPLTKPHPLSDYLLFKGATSVEYKKEKKKFDLDLISSIMSKPKQPCAKHPPPPDLSESNVLASESLMAMSDRHKSIPTFERQKPKKLTSMKLLTLNNSPKSLRNSISKINNSEILNVLEKEEIPGDFLEEETEKAKREEFKSSRVINLDLCDDPLALNPSRKKDPVIRFSDIYKLLGQPRPVSNSKSIPSVKRSSTIGQSRKSLFNMLSLASIQPGIRQNDRRHQAPKLTSITELIRNNSNHLLCRLTNALKAYHNIEEWAVTLEGQKPQFSNILSNKLGGQFSKLQMDLISEFFFTEKGLIRATALLSAQNMVKVLFKIKEDEILMDADKKQIAYLQDRISSDPSNLELIIGLYYSAHFSHDDQQLELFAPATNIFLRLLTEAKATYYAHLSDKCSKKLFECVDRTKVLKYLTKQKDLKTFAVVRAGLDDDAQFLTGIKKGLGLDWFKGRGIDRGGDMGGHITEEEKEFNRKLKGILNDMRGICK